MRSAPVPANEASRLRALSASGALNDTPQKALDRIARAAARAASAPIGLVSFISADWQWIKAAAGTTITDTDRSAAFCAWAVYNAELLWVEDALEDARFADNPLVLGEPSIRAYAGAPIFTQNGLALGTVCAIDCVPRAFDARIAARLTALARQASTALTRAGEPARAAA